MNKANKGYKDHHANLTSKKSFAYTQMSTLENCCPALHQEYDNLKSF